MAVRRMRLGSWVAGAAAITLLAVGCGDDGYGSDDDPPEDGVTTDAPEDTEADSENVAAVFERDACELLTDDQVAEVLGEGATAESTPGDAAIAQPAACTWSSADGTVDFEDPQPTGITVFLGDRQIYDNTRILAEDGDTFEELDIGDEAYAGDGEGGVLVDEIGITVTPIGTDVNDPATHDLIVELLGLVEANA